ncbi:cytochrome P450, partial [Geodermatophilus sp. YIM 151500]|nr:cytochrome P450 [Geodermatophilus sp. YIM 151500]
MSTTQTALTVRHPITVGSPEFRADSHGHYAWLRANAPVYRGRLAYLTERDVWLVSRYEDCKALLRDPRFPRSPGGGGSAMAAELPEHLRLLSAASMLMKDGEEHKRLRKLVAKPFTVRAIEHLADRVRELAGRLLDELEPRGRVDLKKEFALPIPLTVISEMVGVDEAEKRRFHRGAQVAVGETERIGEDRWTAEITALIDFVRELVERHRGDPRDNILTGLIRAEEEGDRLSDDELVTMVLTLVTAGYETTYHLISNA